MDVVKYHAFQNLANDAQERNWSIKPYTVIDLFSILDGFTNPNSVSELVEFQSHYLG